MGEQSFPRWKDETCPHVPDRQQRDGMGVVPMRIAVVAALWAGLYLWSARDVWVHVHHRLQLRWGALFAMPMLVAARKVLARAGG